ncbi:hypothetical protein ACO22_06546 [Paracoccidioides brasiliensis]|uniref:Uncharacterized protein n=1 Tax=Paracoccidioides brasiliensis TaxID=121759 RepID=A0A1D2J791_PARBR|nr:hypothetical protein ACO22_06546 [Paracoccidioides brasiliensis]
MKRTDCRGGQDEATNVGTKLNLTALTASQPLRQTQVSGILRKRGPQEL